MDEEFDIIYVPANKPKETPGTCRFNIGVTCTEKSLCPKCGWNPEVNKIRVEKIRRSMS